MVDIHSHVLWGMDDGSPDENVSLEMLRMAAEAGTTDIVATPHSNAEYEYVPEIIDERLIERVSDDRNIPAILLIEVDGQGVGGITQRKRVSGESERSEESAT